MRRSGASILTLASLCAGLARAAPAQAGDPAEAPPAPPSEAAEETDPGAGARRSAAPDERRGHLYFGAFGTAMGPAGSMGPNTSSTSLASAGLGAGGFVGVGVGRHVTLQAFGDWTRMLAPAACGSGCGGRSYSVGLGLTYHLAQGLAFDPWASFGVAYRNSSFLVIDPAAPAERVTQAYHGIDVARIALGGDFYPTPFFGFGPFLEADFGTNFRWPRPLVALPADVSNTARTYAMFQVGIRIAFDPLRRAAAAPQKQAARRSSPGM